MTRRALIFQQMPGDHPGRFSEWLSKDGFAVDTVNFDAGQSVPNLAPYDLLLVLGGAMDVWQVDEYPWLDDEQQAIREWAGERAKPYIGICLGHQLLATALGGSVGLTDNKEIGLRNITINQNTSHVFLDGLDLEQKVLRWHHAEVKQTPSSATVLATSDTIAVQAMAIGEHALGVQFHFEWTPDGIRNWPQSWPEALLEEKGEGAHQKFIADAEQHTPGIARMTRSLYDNLKRANGL